MKNNQNYYMKHVEKAREAATGMVEAGESTSTAADVGHVLLDAISCLEGQIRTGEERPWTQYRGGENYDVELRLPEGHGSKTFYRDDKPVHFECEAADAEEAVELAKIRYPKAKVKIISVTKL